MTGCADRACPGHRTRKAATRLATTLAAGALVATWLLVLPADAAPAEGEPKDALTLVRQALAALEVTPPADSVALRKIIYALLSPDTRGVDMARVQEAAQDLGALDPAGAAAQLIDALRPGGMTPAGIDMALLTPVRPQFTGTPVAYALLIAAAALVAAGAFVGRR